MENIGKFSLVNTGGFLVRLYFYYWDSSNNRQLVEASDSYPIGNTNTVDPGDYGVPAGSEVSIYASVVAGSDNTTSKMFIYTPNLDQVAQYVISGTTFNNYLGLIIP